MNGLDETVSGRRNVKWLGFLLPLLAFCVRDRLPAWEWMWMMALALFLGAKFITISNFVIANRQIRPATLLGYCLVWPGMDPAPFCRKLTGIRATMGEWAFAFTKTAIGVVIVWGIVPRVALHHAILGGWTGMIGIVFILHFGLFHFLSIGWRRLGFDARPIMRSPGTAMSVSKFWSENWNNAFSDLVHAHLFRPLAKIVGPQRAMFAVFLASGSLHELVISVPARGGYGLPTTYFLLQAAALIFERSKSGRALGLGAGWKGWCFVLAVTGGPAFLLFPPVFVRNVILPMLHAIGAT